MAKYTQEDFYSMLDSIRDDPKNWFIYSGQAYEIARYLHSDSSNTVLFYESLIQALADIGIILGEIGKDKYNRVISRDYYGTSCTPSVESIKFIRNKKAQYKRVTDKLLAKQRKTREQYEHYDQICKTSHKPTISRQKKYDRWNRIAELDRRMATVFNALQAYRIGCNMEFGFECEFAAIEEKF